MPTAPVILRGYFRVEKNALHTAVERARDNATAKWVEALRKQGYTCISQVWCTGPLPSFDIPESSEVKAKDAFEEGRDAYWLAAYFVRDKPYLVEILVPDASTLKKENGLWLPPNLKRPT